jgi:hypothetical protein
MSQSVIDAIVTIEWDMFSNVQNRGGKAACQLHPGVFTIMRRSHIEGWPLQVQKSYCNDVTMARDMGRNLVSEKYAWMMQSTFSEEYAQIAHLLPELEQEALNLIEDIVSINVGWKEAVLRAYPALGRNGRTLRTADDTPNLTSFETYLRGECKTFSLETLRLLHEHTLALDSAEENGVKDTLFRQVRRYGYETIEDAEKICLEMPDMML